MRKVVVEIQQTIASADGTEAVIKIKRQVERERHSFVSIEILPPMGQSSTKECNQLTASILRDLAGKIETGKFDS